MVTAQAILGMVAGSSTLMGIIGTFLVKKMWNKYWNIPVVILKFTGDKRRPTIALTKGRKQYTLGRNRLWVRGYRLPLRDFQSENYFPALGSKEGGLVLWEFKKGWLTPVRPSLKGLSKEEQEKVLALDKQFQELREKFQGVRSVDFEYGEEVYRQLVLKAIDDIDVEWFLRQQERIDAQYTGGWREFLQKYGGHLIIALVAVCLLVGFIVWLKEAPSQANACIQAGVEAAKQTYLSNLASQAGVVPPG